jgi:hypothetical protein
MGVNDSEIHPTAGFGINGVELLGSATTVLVIITGPCLLGCDAV